VASTAVALLKEEHEAMPVVRVLLREGQEKLYYDAHASIHTPDRTLRITRDQDSIAEFQSEYYQYWEYVEDTNAGTGEDTQTDPSVSG
jgi:hypothetical protein